MATVTPTQDHQDEQAPATGPDTTAATPVAELFKYSSYVHVGPGAEGCEHGTDGACSDAGHFHAWCRMPNQFQHTDIRQRAMAAKARRIRQMRDPASDSNAILEADMDELARTASHDELVDAVIAHDWWKRQLQASQDAEEDERFEHIDRDRERWQELTAMDPEARPREEFAELERHFAAFGEAIEKRVAELEGPLRDALSARDTNDLVDMIREERISSEASQAFMDTYSKWEWYAGTLIPARPTPSIRAFQTVEDLEGAAPEVVEALRATFAELETNLQRSLRGNS